MFTIKQNDTSPALRADLKNSAGAAVNVTAATVRFLMRPSGETTPKVDKPGVVISGTTGTVQYDWDAEDTDTSGSYDAEFEITYADGKIETFPNGAYIKIKIVDDIA